MSDKRRPDFILSLRTADGRSRKCELFHVDQWRGTKIEFWSPKGHRLSYVGHCFRVRVAGVWFRDDHGNDLAFSQYEIRDIFWRSIRHQFARDRIAKARERRDSQ